ncbi:DUF1365 family protein [Nakamurella aerolata]|uniref:DUF1365 family protein n=1 Tax=Nakamurella aerolata TaxID=1656892 RepID=UPI001BB2791A
MSPFHPATPATTVPVPALVTAAVTHRRVAGVDDRHTFKLSQLLLDADDTAGMDVSSRDHLYGNGFRADIAVLLAAAGRPLLAADRIVMLAQPRRLGRVFDPLTVWWVLDGATAAPGGTGGRGADAGGAVREVILEVHNTYGERHAYLLDPDGITATSTGWHGKHLVRKGFYVSPFNPPSGNYRVHWRLRPDQVSVSIALSDDDGAATLTATLIGALQPLRTGWRRRARRHAAGAPVRVPALIRARGIWLWARRLPIQRRPTDGGNLRPPGQRQDVPADA